MDISWQGLSGGLGGKKEKEGRMSWLCLATLAIIVETPRNMANCTTSLPHILASRSQASTETPFINP